MRQTRFKDIEHFKNHLLWSETARKRFLDKLKEELPENHKASLLRGLITSSRTKTIIEYTLGVSLDKMTTSAHSLIEDVVAYIENTDDDLTSDGDLEWYINCLWFLSFCYFFKASKEKIQIIADHISLTGKDMLIDRLIAASIPGSSIAVGQLAFPEVYKPLSEALASDQTTEERTEKIQLFLKNYYSLLKKYQVGWHDNHKAKPDFCYHFGYWIFELGALAADIGWDDTAYRDHEMYPKDLVDWKFAQRPDYRRSKI